MVDDADDFSDMTEPAEDAGSGAKQSPTMWVHAPCLNFIEHELTEMQYLEPALQTDVEFIEIEDAPTPQHPDTMPDDPLALIRGNIASCFIEHISLARSLGSGSHVTWQSYVEACQREGLTPMKRRTS
jgi:hypothetical protein